MASAARPSSTSNSPFMHQGIAERGLASMVRSTHSMHSRKSPLPTSRTPSKSGSRSPELAGSGPKAMSSISHSPGKNVTLSCALNATRPFFSRLRPISRSRLFSLGDSLPDQATPRHSRTVWELSFSIPM